MKVLLDACVLFPTVLREILQGAGEAGLFEPIWSDRILGEWTHSSAKLGAGVQAVAEGEAALFRAAFPRGRVQPQPGIEARLVLPDEGDLHVLASAIAGHADAIVTFNARDFPGHVLAAEGIARRDPDGFLWELYSHQPQKMGEVVERVRAKAEALSGNPVLLKPLLKRVRLFRLAKAMMA
ncbi:PIN domain-containing protein [Xinfangfangia sp. D13-10-4-6]|uniref:RSP_2648 family PIN domain-containing protein n=1 Tax=Pseudogemmobacter hezensis TaxID=2737662 RepID=UPI001552067D|nr:PIN domain-containing protein [Pseudogemmobacter hezensis]NPD15860.1 PIN domain-containing protein [Pseudogemmobacter hezensis]